MGLYTIRTSQSRLPLKSRLSSLQRRGRSPTQPTYFSGESSLDAPDFILPLEKKQDLERMWKDKPEGQARLYGKFFTNIPLALPSLDKNIHILPITSTVLATFSHDLRYKIFKRLPRFSNPPQPHTSPHRIQSSLTHIPTISPRGTIFTATTPT